MGSDHDLLRAFTALVAKHNRATMLRPCEPPDIFLERDDRSVLGVRIASLRAIDTSDVICRRPRPTVRPGGLVRMLVGLGASYVVQSLAELSAGLAEFRDCVKVSAVVTDPSTSSYSTVSAHRAIHRSLPVSVRIDRRLGAKFLLVDAKIPREASMNGKSMLLTVSLADILLFRADVAIVEGHVHTSACNHERSRAGLAFQAAVDGNLYELCCALQPTGWSLWFRGGCGDSTEEMHSDVGRRGVFSTGAFHYAASWGDISIVDVLIRAGADVNASNVRDETALQDASGEGHTDVVKRLLIESHTDINFPNSRGDPALHLAIYGKREDVLANLLADPFLDMTLKNRRGSTALDIARINGNVNIIRLLEREVGQRWWSAIALTL